MRTEIFNLVAWVTVVLVAIFNLLIWFVVFKA